MQYCKCSANNMTKASPIASSLKQLYIQIFKIYQYTSFPTPGNLTEFLFKYLHRRFLHFNADDIPNHFQTQFTYSQYEMY